MEPNMSFAKYKLFEEEVGIYLSQHLSEGEMITRGEIFSRKSNIISSTIPDFFFLKGCRNLSFPPKTAIEVKYNLRYPIVVRTIDRYRRLFQQEAITKLVFIYNNTDGSDVDFIKSRIVEVGIDVGIVDVSEIKTIDVTDVNKIEDSGPNTIERARESFKNNNYTFFLGAGLSMDAKLPSWTRLLESLMKQEKRIIDGEERIIPFNNLNEENSDSISIVFGNSSIIAGRYAFDGYRRAYKSEDEIYQGFVDRIRKALYTKQQYKSPLISSVVRAIKRKTPAQIITYNYDDLLDSRLNKNKFVSVIDNVIPREKVTPIYHVHGMISRDELTLSKPVLSEKEYHLLYRNPQNWTNVVQLYALYSSVCFFIGFSMTDPNQRRLLELARYKDSTDDIPHFVFLQRKPLKGEASALVNKEHWKEVEIMMSDFGLNVIWFNSFEELPGIIDYISGVSKPKPQVCSIN